MEKSKTFVVIDGNSVAHRAFHAMPALTNKKGQPVGAVHGFLMALFRAVEDFRPDHMAVCFDTKGGTFRNREFKDYKSQRPETPPDLVSQLATIKDLLPELGVAVFAMEGFEADDLIASVIKSARLEPNGREATFFILTGDHDSLQLVDSNVKVFMINRGVKNAVLYDKIKVKEIFGVTPEQIPDFKALAGDPSDNIPGAPGIGPKAAQEILGNCGTLEKALADAQSSDEISCFGKGVRAQKTKAIILENQEKIISFQRLATMISEAPLGQVMEKCVFDDFNGDRPGAALLDLGLASAAKRLPQGKISRNGTLF